jgi:hypothetical protein
VDRKVKNVPETVDWAGAKAARISTALQDVTAIRRDVTEVEERDEVEVDRQHRPAKKL